MGVLALALSAVAVASPQFTQSAKVKLTTKKAGKSTGVLAKLRATDEGEPGGKPKAASRIVIKLPRGTRVNTRAAKQCNVSDQQVLEGKCPRKSLIGRGQAKANVAPLIPSTTEDVKAYASKRGIILLLTDNEADPAPAQALVLHARVSKRGKIVVKVPELQPVPGVFAVLTDFTLRTKPVSKGRGARRINLITSPRRCNPRKGWVSTTVFTYADGSARDVIKTRARCRR
ncbi:MAG: hypothetical protein WD993_02130 [Thermoleophilaceae bacterium]